MKFQPLLLGTLIIGFTPQVQSHSASAVLGGDASNSALAHVTCLNDGTGEPAALISQIKDMSQPDEGLLLSVQLLKGTQVINSTDSISGDANYSPLVALEGGAGVYNMMLTKTAEGERTFDLIWHCMTADGLHTGTDIVVRQYK
jgi:hypothetical protein